MVFGRGSIGANGMLYQNKLLYKVKMWFTFYRFLSRNRVIWVVWCDILFPILQKIFAWIYTICIDALLKTFVHNTWSLDIMCSCHHRETATLCYETTVHIKTQGFITELLAIIIYQYHTWCLVYLHGYHQQLKWSRRHHRHCPRSPTNYLCTCDL